MQQADLEKTHVIIERILPTFFPEQHIHSKSGIPDGTVRHGDAELRHGSLYLHDAQTGSNTAIAVA
jgi:hypothetical protein